MDQTANEPKAKDGTPIVKASPETDRILKVGLYYEWQIFIPKFKVWYTWCLRNSIEELEAAAREQYHTDISGLDVFQMSAEDFKNLIASIERDRNIQSGE